MASEPGELQETQRRYLETIVLSLRPNTVINSRSVTTGFIRYLNAKHPQVSSFSQLDRSYIEDWLRYLGSQPLRRNTRRNNIIKLRVFLETIRAWSWKEAPQDALFRRGDLPPEDRCLPRPLSEETDRALQAKLRERGGLIHLALLLLRATGLRSQELRDLKVDALRKLPGGEWSLHVPLGKLHSERVIPIDEATLRIFEKILELRGSPPPVTDPETGKPAPFLIMHPEGGRFRRDALRYHLGRIEKIIPLQEHPTPHRLRHTYATAMLRAGMSLPVLMKLLGHRTIGMTLRYAQITAADVRRAYHEAIGALEGRYAIPSQPALNNHSTRTPQAIASQMANLAAQVEAWRRDVTTGSRKKQLQRFVERLRRFAQDFQKLLS